MTGRWKWIGCIPVGVTLLCGLGLQIGGIRDSKRGDTESVVRPIGLSDQIPLVVSGWTGRDESLGSTEFLESVTERNLNYDDMVNRVYQRPGEEFGVYIGYWSPGRMPVQKVASHTPDRCWTENGWFCIDYRRDVDLTAASGAQLYPSQWREFRPPSSQDSTYVLYWHLVGGDLYDYGEGLNKSLGPIAWWKETLHYAFKGSADQYFIRLTSNRPFDEIWEESGVQEVVEALVGLGVRAKGQQEKLKTER